MAAYTKTLIGRIRRVSLVVGVPERELCRIAGLKSESHLAAAWSRSSNMGWDNLGPIVELLVKGHGATLEWLFLGQLPMVRVSVPAQSKPPAVVHGPSDAPPRAGENSG